MIFRAQNLYDLKDYHVDFRNVFTHGFKVMFDGSQVGVKGFFEIDTERLMEQTWVISFNSDYELEDKDFPLYFELHESDEAKEERQGRYLTPDEFKCQQCGKVSDGERKFGFNEKSNVIIKCIECID